MQTEFVVVGADASGQQSKISSLLLFLLQL